ncbi:MAG: UDP-2,3-diacylglucosamine diphosphatase [Candidatus Edwardsbacteria bacterium]|nr:UDP-2,3-diacylglucosamine diphosphatase [Candidatus Edwardsbacteria bacterium]
MIYFISDVHLGSAGHSGSDREKLSKLGLLFDRITGPGDRLFILGDLFDFWFEYRSVIQKEHLEILGRFKDLRSRGVAVDLLVGNHDFWIGDFLSRELGITVHRQSLALESGGKKMFLAHGDGLGKGDLGYKILKVVLRNPFTIWLYRLLHPDLAIPFAKWFSQVSRNHLTRDMHLDPGPMLEVAREKFAQGFDFVLLGHTHLPTVHEENGKIYINLGDFIASFSYAVFRDGILTLEYIK